MKMQISVDLLSSLSVQYVHDDHVVHDRSTLSVTFIHEYAKGHFQDLYPLQHQCHYNINDKCLWEHVKMVKYDIVRQNSEKN